MSDEMNKQERIQERFSLPPVQLSSTFPTDSLPDTSNAVRFLSFCQFEPEGCAHTRTHPTQGGKKVHTTTPPFGSSPPGAEPASSNRPKVETQTLNMLVQHSS
eukprot:6466249-Amphidinium_carterae.1